MGWKSCRLAVPNKVYTKKIAVTEEACPQIWFFAEIGWLGYQSETIQTEH
jgi:hypothetical protein